MSEPKVTIDRRELEIWHARIIEGLEPEVPYSKDPKVMLESAYEARGKTLYYLNHRLLAFIGHES